MAAGTLNAPGSEWGPCVDLCGHRDCGASRAMATARCGLCAEPIGYAVRFYRVDPIEGADTLADSAGRSFTMVHASCEERRVDEGSR